MTLETEVENLRQTQGGSTTSIRGVRPTDPANSPTSSTAGDARRHQGTVSNPGPAQQAAPGRSFAARHRLWQCPKSAGDSGGDFGREPA